MAAPSPAPLPLASRETHRRRVLSAAKAGFALIAFSLLLGMAGYSVFEGLGPLDAFLNAAMVLSGMGPVDLPKTTAGKLFAGLYAIYSGFAVLGIAAVIFAPAVHRIFHKLRIADAEREPRT
ncbi:MAG TPA: hypothetical protein VEG27_08035 [Usitatibacter sp.]|nr:hypothetical protein [Usitatibacter sp.]